MANKKITDLPELAEAPNDNDLFEIVDVSTGISKRIKAQYLGGGAGSTPTLDEVLAVGAIGNIKDITLVFDPFDGGGAFIASDDTLNNQSVLNYTGLNIATASNKLTQLSDKILAYSDVALGFSTTVMFTEPTGVNGLINIPDVAGSTETLALLSDIPTVANATETVAGIAEIATTAEVTTGTDDTRIVTPLKLKQVTDNYMQVILNCNVLGSTVSGGTNIVLYQVNVPANTFSDLDAFEIEALGAKVGVTATSTIRLWTDTVSTFNSGTAQLLAVSASLGATNLYQTIKREFHVRGTTVKCLVNTIGVATDEATAALTANQWASYTFNPAVANTLYLTVTGNAADTFTKQNYKITRYKNKSTI
jgi:hypothetical protein